MGCFENTVKGSLAVKTAVITKAGNGKAAILQKDFRLIKAKGGNILLKTHAQV